MGLDAVDGVLVTVPATVANLGPGFDCLGVAVGTHLELTVARSERPEMAGGDPSIELEENLTYRAYSGAFAAAGEPAPPVRIEVVASYPPARGLGASASAIVAGLVAARTIGGLDLTDNELAQLAVRLEGHADNVLPALFGGLVLASTDGWLRFTPSTAVAPMLCVARDPFRTADARRALPDHVARADAVANAAATAALVAVLTGAESPEMLMMATVDRLHEPYRLPLMPETLALYRGLREDGVAAALSGAGPSIVALVPADGVDHALAVAQRHLPAGWHVLAPGWDLLGAQARAAPPRGSSG
ncbi:MAG TPA: homoserine kinase [Actinomycetota bacterium]|nr:homoserine kinase [Actinomycetota bacterium]